MAILSVAAALRGEIQSCTGWKLNKLPGEEQQTKFNYCNKKSWMISQWNIEVKRFLKESGNADIYENLEVNFIPGRNPDLIIYVSSVSHHIRQ